MKKHKRQPYTSRNKSKKCSRCGLYPTEIRPVSGNRNKMQLLLQQGPLDSRVPKTYEKLTHYRRQLVRQTVKLIHQMKTYFIYTVHKKTVLWQMTSGLKKQLSTVNL